MTQVTVANLTIPSQDYRASELLKAWDWIMPLGLELVMITKLGDAFLIDPRSKAIYFLDTLDGEFEPIAPNVDGFKECLQDPEFVADYFSCDLLEPVLDQDIPQGKVLNFEKPPVLGGEYSTQALVLFDVQQHFDDLGHLWCELSQIDLDDEDHE